MLSQVDFKDSPNVTSPQTIDNKTLILKHPHWARCHITVQAEDNEHRRDTLSFNLRPFLATDYTTNEGLEADLDNPLLTTDIAFLNTYFSSLNMNLTNITIDLTDTIMNLKNTKKKLKYSTAPPEQKSKNTDSFSNCTSFQSIYFPYLYIINL